MPRRGLDRGRRLPRATPSGRFAINALGTRHVAEAARRVGARLCYVSTDYVFDGTKPDAVRRERRAEPPARSTGTRSWPASWRPARRRPSPAPPGSAGVTAGTWSRPSCAWRASRTGSRFVDDQRGHPTFADDLAAELVELVDGGRRGHVPRDQPGRGVLVRVRPGRAGGGRRTRTGCDPMPPPSSTHPGRRPVPPTRSWRTPHCVTRGSNCSSPSRSLSTAWYRSSTTNLHRFRAWMARKVDP